MKKVWIVVALLVSFLATSLLAGCGQTGDLYMPNPQKSKKDHDTFLL